jgi:hypothetical protein
MIQTSTFSLIRSVQRVVNIVFTGCLLANFNSASAQNNAPTYPKIAVYLGILHPLVTFSSDGTYTNFDGSYTVGMPTGINIWKSAGIGFSMEMVPTIRAENGVSKMSNFLFHPGVLVALGHGYTFAGRAAFETSGRYGVTPVFNKVLLKKKDHGYFAAIPLPVRFGNDKPTSFTIGFQFGIVF